MKGRDFRMFKTFRKNMTAEMKAVPLESFADCFQKLFRRFNKLIQVGGDYFE
jgi:hypothetical protein